MIEDFVPTLLFKVLFVVDGFKPQFANDVDPAGDPLKVKLEPIGPPPTDERCMLNGLVIGPEGEPVVGAMIWPEMAMRVTGRGSYGTRVGTDAVAVTNAKGLFRMDCTVPLKYMHIQIEARGLATAKFRELASGKKAHELKLVRGATVTGRLLLHGSPLPDIAMGLAQTSRSSRTFVGEYVIATDEHGRFRFDNVAPDFEYCVYGKMESLKDIGAVPARIVKMGETGSVLEVGDLQVVRGHRLSGRVVLTDGKPIPPNTRLYVGRQPAWDSAHPMIAPDGRFEIGNLPGELFRVSASVKGYRPSLQNQSLDLPHPSGLMGRIDTDITDLIILLEPGERREPKMSADPARRERPLKGVSPEDLNEP